mmetsp:Transcript_82693/g.213072  ORF Transcript_82693/g.213072 Transcript_82693/m.213072 type:complete len:248 (-) Transcript_82693:496-1239(-)
MLTLLGHPRQLFELRLDVDALLVLEDRAPLVLGDSHLRDVQLRRDALHGALERRRIHVRVAQDRGAVRLCVVDRVRLGAHVAEDAGVGALDLVVDCALLLALHGLLRRGAQPIVAGDAVVVLDELLDAEQRLAGILAHLGVALRHAQHRAGRLLAQELLAGGVERGLLGELARQQLHVFHGLLDGRHLHGFLRADLHEAGRRLAVRLAEEQVRAAARDPLQQRRCVAQLVRDVRRELAPPLPVVAAS